jgi:hypothetical protein
VTYKRPTKAKVILETWRSLDAASAGEAELKLIQAKLVQVLGEGGVASPASIARTLADEDVILRHPELLAFDSRWRESRIYALFGPGELSFDNLENALESVAKIRDLGEHLDSEGDESGMKSLADYVKRLRAELNVATPLNVEVAEWLKVWLQNPVIFNDWLGLRLNSEGFRDKFSS